VMRRGAYKIVLHNGVAFRSDVGYEALPYSVGDG
jgi:hypothetical protein